MDIDRIPLSDSLAKEHHALRRALNVLRTMTERLERGIQTDRHDVNALLIFLHYFGDVLHQSKEESILFPALQSSDKCPEDLKSRLGEHVQQRGLIEKTQFLLFTDLQDEFVASARKLIDLLSKHADEEEHVLFPLAARILTAVKAEEVSAKLGHSDAQFGERQLRLLMDMLHQLEGKYIQKAA